MGVRNYYVLKSSGEYFTGPHAYTKILAVREAVLQANVDRRVPVVLPPLIKIGGWRKRIVTAYKALENIAFERGSLQVISCRCGRTNQRYHDILNWVNAHTANLGPPRP